MLTISLLAKGIADLSFGGALLWYLVKYVVSIGVAIGAVLLGIKLRKRKNAKVAANEAVTRNE